MQKKYKELLDHYGIKGEMTNPGSPNENGDSEQSHHRFKRAVDQSLMLRGSRDFSSREEYESFLHKLFGQLNKTRMKKFHEETAVMEDLPLSRIDTCSVYNISVRRNATISVKHKIYSVPSRLIGEKVKVKVYQEYLEVYYGQKKIETMKRIGRKGISEYLKILELTSKNGEDEVRSVLMFFQTSGVELSFEKVREKLDKEREITLPGSMEIELPVLDEYDRIFFCSPCVPTLCRNSLKRKKSSVCLKNLNNSRDSMQ
ncbi:MAG: hypothetical protein R6W70_03665 [bacterium]